MVPKLSRLLDAGVVWVSESEATMCTNESKEIDDSLLVLWAIGGGRRAGEGSGLLLIMGGLQVLTRPYRTSVL